MESPDTIHGRMKEGAHLAGYSLQRTLENLRWLLEDSRYEQLSAGYSNVNDFLRDIQESFSLLNIKPEERKQIAELVKELQPKASQRAIADMVGVSVDTVARDLGYEPPVRNQTITAEKQDEIVGFQTPAIPPDDMDLVERERFERQLREKKDQREKERQDERRRLIEAAESISISDRFNIECGDISTWATDKQYDFIITDPPYPREYLDLYGVLAERAQQWLKPSGLLIAMCGQSYLDNIIAMMDEHLNYYWTAAYLLPGQPTPLRQRQVNTSWKPLLIYSRDEYRGKIFGDVFISDANDKDYHKWGQSVSGMYSIISQICLPGQSILDPFCGAGTTGVAALQHGCLFDGIDIDVQNVNISKGRLNDTIKAG